LKDLVEIRWHARGGQGAKTATDFCAEAVISAGKYGQAFPEYGPERSGAPIRGFTRVSSQPVRRHCAVDEPDIIIVLDETLFASGDLCEGLKEGGVLIVNTPKSPSEIRQISGFKKGKVFTVDATKIALEEIGRNIPNMPMIGALAKTTSILKLEDIYSSVKHKFLKKMGEKIVQGNIEAIKRAYKEVKGDG